MELSSKWSNQQQEYKKFGEKLKKLFWQTIFWCSSIAEKIFWSDILQENPCQISMFKNVLK